MSVVKIGNVWTVNDGNYKSRSFTFDFAQVTAQGKPTRATVGVHEGWSLPIYNSDNEELFTCDCVPGDWDGVTNPVFLIGGWLDTANTSKNFKLQVSVACVSNGEIVGATTTDLKVETATGTASQYQFFIVQFPWNAVAGGCVSDDAVGIRIRRIAAGSNEITGEFVVKGLGIKYKTNKAGSAS